VNTFSAVIGTSMMRTPQASNTALAMAEALNDPAFNLALMHARIDDPSHFMG